MKTILFLSFMAVCGLLYGVFNMEQHVQMLRGELTETNRQLKENLDELHVLKAEWSYLTHPKRLENIAKNYLKTNVASFQQIRAIDSVPLQQVVVRKETVNIGLVNDK